RGGAAQEDQAGSVDGRTLLGDAGAGRSYRALPPMVFEDTGCLSGDQFGRGLSLLVRSILDSRGALPCASPPGGFRRSTDLGSQFCLFRTAAPDQASATAWTCCHSRSGGSNSAR